MPLQLADVGKERRSFIWEYLGEDVEVVYNIYKYTPEFEDEIEALVGDSDYQTKGLVEMFLEVVIDWDVFDGDEKVPLTHEALGKVPVRIIADLFQAIGEDAGGDAEEGKASGGRSLPNRATRRRHGGTSSRRQGSFTSSPGS